VKKQTYTFKNWNLIKKVTSLMLCILMCLSITACAKQEDDEIKKVLKSSHWVYESPILAGSTKIYEFRNNGKFITTFYVGTKKVETEGTYVITDNEIIIEEDEIDYSIDFTFEDGVLELTRDGTALIPRSK